MSLPGAQDGEEPFNAYEQERAARILRNQRVMGERLFTTVLCCALFVLTHVLPWYPACPA